ncbi:hypothetical protein H310_08626 [Aphanomyces invadans]|uniref:B30.2/SPRY domain-containing protein n=1 Tax=Aphanomyces invadans TaxID=157072 RepID=A0A024TWV2_9STRA|nr:hypothetical protein H310_08626 [Aphanomyces invadans]ETV98488.1 hypothetical protein H310_08626 [Aphanomyces invadans]|eukprot:XP_008872685.1 hypothetical protein H310_08626 [Aphanomyces invadans]
MWVATPFGIGVLITDGDWEIQAKVTVQFPWGIGYLQRHIVSTSHTFQCTCFALPRTLQRFALTLELTTTFAALCERVLVHAGMPLLLVDNVVVMQPCFGGPDDCRIGSDGVVIRGQLRFSSLRPLLIHIFPTIKIAKTSSLLRISANDKGEAAPPLPAPPASTEPPLPSQPATTLPPCVQNASPSAGTTAANSATNSVPTQELSPVVTQIGRGAGCVLGAERTLTSGRKYWEVRLDTTVVGNGVLVGVAVVDVPLNSNVVGTDCFWGFAAHLGKKASDTFETYGQVCVKGDVVGTLYDAELGELSFFRNGEPLGVAFRHLYFARFCPAFATTSVGLAFTLLPRTVPPPYTLEL